MATPTTITIGHLRRSFRFLSASMTLRSHHCLSSLSLGNLRSSSDRLLSSPGLSEVDSSFRLTSCASIDNTLLLEASIKKISSSWHVYKPNRRAFCSVFQPNLTKTRGFLLLNQTANMSTYTIIEKGTLNTKDYRIYFNGPSGLVSPFHDIPLHADTSKTVFNMVVEIPRWTNHKMEICKEEKLNPIKQDIKKEKVRFVKNLFPHHGYIWNYGALPQTWEDPNHTEPETKTKGDSDPIDVCEIGSKIHQRGAVVQVKALGVMCLIDEGETDWKVLAIDVNDPLANVINDVEDIEKHMPGFLKATYEWFRYYKVPDGKPENQFAFNGEAKNKAYALKVIEETHKQWEGLMNKTIDAAGISCENTTVGGSPYKFALEEAKTIVENQPALTPPASLPSDVDQWHYISK